ncbi:MAG: hypothetical protein ABSG83_15085 [Roseiarcus sp.]|jgi:hypothetical protein
MARNSYEAAGRADEAIFAALEQAMRAAALKAHVKGLNRLAAERDDAIGAQEELVRQLEALQ